MIDPYSYGVNISAYLAVMGAGAVCASVIWIFALIHVADLIKCVIGYVLLKKGVWIRNIVKE